MTPRLHALVADGERPLVVALGETLRSAGLEVTTACDGIAARRLLQRESFDLLLSDIRLPGVSGIQLLQEVRERDLDTPVALMTRGGSVNEAVTALKLGANDYLCKPVLEDQLSALVQSAQCVQMMRETSADTYSDELSFLIGRSPSWRRVVDRVRTVAATESTVLIHGESGTGKELVARALHVASPRRGEPFVAVNCAALSPTLLESELFGHERGAFTGAVSTVRGRFELANRGTLLLDEVDEIPVALQVKLLRVIQERVVERVGGGSSIPVDVRIVATTKRCLKEMVHEGTFRRDLYYRLAVVPVVLPALAERREDIPVLALHFMKVFSARMPNKPRAISRRALALLMDHEFPGNVRELEHSIEAACALCAGDEVDVEHLPDDVRAAHSSPQDGCGSPIVPLATAVEGFERDYLEQLLGCFGGTRAELAARLGLSRKGLWQKLKKYNLPAACTPDAVTNG